MNAGGVDKACKSNAGSWTLETRNWKEYTISSMKSFRDLEVYQRASTLFPKIYKMVRSWNANDQKEIGSQIIRAANSIHANIAEGFGKTPADFKRYLGNSLGSCDEIVSHLADAHNVGLIAKNMFDELIAEYAIVGKQLNKLKQNWK